ncbi:hypothetical protein PYW08_006560 [Mythimna loreyi]|uniref:Uncharacterized protein n=1 Tax=Mythimna loreyi TaxID=667449 RepID=A0ACC2QS33_9NEOP|nr:hypothetical protein PYW08_006560 [Mythimna loreyi]
MPINRSPPPTTASSSLDVPLLMHTIHHTSSEPNITTIDSASCTDGEFLNITHRNKRKCSDSRTIQDNQLSVLMAEMKNMFTEFKVEQGKHIEKLCQSIQEIKSQNNTIQDSVSFLSKDNEELKGKIGKLEEQLISERKSTAMYIQNLEAKIETLERGARSSCIEIKNIPVNKSETKESLLKTVINIGSILQVPIQPFEVKDTFRVSSKDPEIKTIIVDFTSNILKEKFIEMSKKFHRGHNKLTTETLGFNGTSKPVFISENLTQKMKRVFFLARDFANTHQYKYCWIRNGKVFLRQKDGDRYYIIKDDSDLKNIISDK